MTNEGIIEEWKKGLSKEAVAKEYMKVENERRKRVGEKKINKAEALAYVEPTIFKYQVSLMRGAKDNDNRYNLLQSNALQEQRM